MLRCLGTHLCERLSCLIYYILYGVLSGVLDIKKDRTVQKMEKKNRFHHLWDFLSMANLSIYIHTYIQVCSSHNFCSLGISYFSHVSIAFSASNNIRLRYQALVALGVCCLEPSHYIHFHQGISYRRIFWISLLFNTRGVLKK